MADLTIRQVNELVLRGQIRIPQFQRGFVWEPEMVAFFMDSVYKRYPFGALLFWRTKEPLRAERQLGPFVLPDRDPDYPVDYVLDGQQRITSIFGVFQTELTPEGPSDWTQIYFDYRSDPDAQESQFVALEAKDADPDRYFALKYLFDTTGYRRATKGFDEEIARRIDDMQAIFKEALLPVQVVSHENRATVAIIFERVNRTGVPLDTLQLLSAWTWSEEFALQEKFADLTADLEPFGFKEVGVDTNLLLRCCAAVVAQDASPNTLVNLNGAVVRERFQEVVNGVKGAIDFLQNDLNVHSLDNLPYTTFLVPLSVFFAVPGSEQVRYNNEQRKMLVKWFWRCCFSKRYSSGVLRNLKTDIDDMLNLKHRRPSNLGAFSASVGPDFFRDNVFRTNTVNTKAFVLLLAQKHPLSFITGAPISLREVLSSYNRNEFHHIYPRAFLTASGVKEVNPLANFCFLSKADNGQLGGVAPSEYRAKMPTQVDEILGRALCPQTIFSDDFDTFVKDRSELLSAEANKLIE